MIETGKGSSDLADVKLVLEELNRALADEWFAIYQYSSPVPEHAMSPIVVESVSKALGDERQHAEALASRILELKGLPIDSSGEWRKLAHCRYLKSPKDSTTLRAFLQNALEGERCVTRACLQIAKRIFGRDDVTYQLIMNILSEEAEHEEMFQELLQNLPCAFVERK